MGRSARRTDIVIDQKVGRNEGETIGLMGSITGEVNVKIVTAPLESSRTYAPPSLRHNFFGRKSELDQVVRAVAGGKRVALIGVPGIGKATLAKAAWNRLRSENRFDSGCLWVSDVYDGSLEQICDSLAHSLGDLNFAALEASRKPDVLRELLAGNPGHLIVLTNVISEDMTAEFLERCLTPDNNLLISGTEVFHAVDQVVALAQLDHDSAVSLFSYVARTQDVLPANEVSGICSLLGHHPAAIVAAAEVLRNYHLTLEKLTELLDLNLSQLLQRGDPQFWGPFGVAYDSLRPSLQALLRALAAGHGPHMTDELLSAVCELDDFDREILPRELVALSLVERHPINGALRLEPLMRSYVRAQIEDRELELYHRRIEAASVTYMVNQRKLDNQHEMHDKLEAELANLLGALETARERGDYETVLVLSRILSPIDTGVLGRRGYWAQLATVCAFGLEAAEELQRTRWIGRFRHRLAAVKQREGSNHDAELFYLENEALFIATDNRRGLAFTLNNLGEIKRESGEYDKAREYFQRTLELKKEAGEPLASTMHNLGCIDLALGRYESAALLFTLSMEADQLANDQDGIAANQLQIGEIHRLHGEIDSARELLESSRAIYERIDDEDGKAEVMLALGKLEMDTGSYESAMVMLEEVLDIAKHLHFLKLRAETLFTQGLVAYWRLDHSAARRLFTESRGLYEKLGDPAGSANCLHQLGVLAFESAQFAEAQIQLEGAQRQFGHLGLSRELADSSRELGRLHLQRRNFELAELFLKASGEQAQLLGYRKGEAQALYRLGQLEAVRLNKRQAQAYFQQSAQIFADIQSPLLDKVHTELDELNHV